MACILLVLHDKKKPTEETLELQKKRYEEILAKNNVPETHYKIVVGQSKVYNMYICRIHGTDFQNAGNTSQGF